MIYGYIWRINNAGEQRPVHVCATDVSQVCIEVSQQRDQEFMLATDNDNVDTNDYSTRNVLEYRVLNVLQEPRQQQQEQQRPSRHDQWDVILDKGCLDTFMFRSRQRGAENNVYTELLHRALDNIHTWLKGGNKANVNDDGGNDDDNQQQKHRVGVYVLLTPRSKIRAVRDYAGFDSVQRHVLAASTAGTTTTHGDLIDTTNNDNDSNTIVSGALMSKNKPKIRQIQQENTNNNEHPVDPTTTSTTSSPLSEESTQTKPPPSESQPTKTEEMEGKGHNTKKKNKKSSNNNNNNDSDNKNLYMYICRKNINYVVGGDMEPFPRSFRQVPLDETKCRNCDITFQQFRGKESVTLKGEVFWTREWKNHNLHCKAPHKSFYWGKERFVLAERNKNASRTRYSSRHMNALS